MEKIKVALFLTSISLSALTVAEEFKKSMNGESIRTIQQHSLLSSLLSLRKIKASIEGDSIVQRELASSNMGYNYTPLYKMEQIKSADSKSNAVYLRQVDTHENQPVLTLLNDKLYTGNVKLDENGKVVNVYDSNTQSPVITPMPVYTVIDNKVYVGDAIKYTDGKIVDPKTKKASIEIADLKPHLDTAMVRKVRGEVGVKAEREESMLLAMTRSGIMDTALIRQISKLVLRNEVNEYKNNTAISYKNEDLDLVMQRVLNKRHNKKIINELLIQGETDKQAIKNDD